MGAVTHYNLRENTFEFKRSVQDRVLKFMDVDGDKLVWATILVLFAFIAFAKFGIALFD